MVFLINLYFFYSFKLSSFPSGRPGAVLYLPEQLFQFMLQIAATQIAGYDLAAGINQEI